MNYEVCVDSVEGALAAEKAGAQRIELCDNLVEGGTTPSLGMIKGCRRAVKIGLHILIRPRGGDFFYSPNEVEVMQEDILAAKTAGADGVVLGLLLPDGSVDLERTRMLLEIARPMSVSFHRAFDMCRDPFEALEALCGLGVERILTSGQMPSAVQGCTVLARLVRQSAGRLVILAGGGIGPENICEIATKTGVNEVHFSARKTTASPMTFQNRQCFMGKPYQPDEYTLKTPDLERIRAVIWAGDSTQLGRATSG